MAGGAGRSRPRRGCRGAVAMSGAGPRAGPPRIKPAAGAALPAASPAVFRSRFHGGSASRLSRPSRGGAESDPRLHCSAAAAAASPRHPPPPAGRGGHVPAGLHLEYLLRRLRLPRDLPRRRGQLPEGTCPVPGGQRQEGVRRLGRGAHRHRPRQRRLPR